jgi:hypothetical protein
MVVEIGLVLRTPDLSREVEDTLRPTGCRVYAFPFDPFLSFARRGHEMALERGVNFEFPSRNVVVEVTGPEEVGPVFEAIFGERDVSKTFLLHELSLPQIRPPWPRLLMPRTGMGPDDSLTYLGDTLGLPHEWWTPS